MLTALRLSIAQLGDRAFLSVLGRSLAVSIALLATFGVGLWFGVRALARWLGAGEATSGAAGVVAVLAGLALGWLIFRAVAIAVVGLFADDIVAAVEAKHYPQALASARAVPFVRSLAMGAKGGARTILVNLLALPVYIVLIVTGVGPAIGFFLVNAFLLGRDLGDMVAARHVAAPALPAWRGKTRLPRFALGAAGTGLMLVPVLNLIAPIVAAAMATHLFHRRLKS